LKSRDALRDFKTVVKKAPNDKDAKLKLAECEKIVKRVEFFRAIEIGDEPSAAEGLDLDSMVVEADYDGARIGNEMTPEFISDMLDRFKNGKKIHKKYVYQIILAVKRIVYDEATMVEVDIEDDSQLTVCGDTHGKLFLASHGESLLIRAPRPVLRLDGALPIKRLSHRETSLSLQRGFRGSRFLVNRNRFVTLCI
jgi:serine/threonine-protein phosphatase 5